MSEERRVDALGMNPLANILIRHAYLPPRECDEIVAELSKRSQSELGVGPDEAKAFQRVLSTHVLSADLIDVSKVFATLRTPQSIAQHLLAPVLLRHHTKIAAASEPSEIPDSIAFEVFAAIDALISDPSFYASHRSLFELGRSESCARYLSYLQGRGLLGAAGEPLPPSGEASLASIDYALRWFNVALFEGLVFPGGFAKTSRLFRAELDLRQRIDVSATPLVSAFTQASAASATVAAAYERARAGDYLDFLGLITALLADAAARDAVLAALSLPIAHDEDEAVHALHLALAANASQVFTAPRIAQGANQGRAIVTAVRNVQTVDWEDLRPRIAPYTQQFIDKVALPYYCLSAAAVEEIQLARTGAHGFLRPHIDSEDGSVKPDGRTEWIKVRKRDVSLVYYLSRSSDFDGGTLWFPDVGIELRPEQGMAVAFPSDHRYLHCVREVTRGVRWSMATWIDCEGCAPIGTIDQTFSWGR